MDPKGVVLAFHEATKHTPLSVRRGSSRLDFSNEPAKFKEYPELPPIPLPPPAPDTRFPAMDALRSLTRRDPSSRAPSLVELSRILRWGAGVHRVLTDWDGRPYYFRTYASAGALYPIEVYLAWPGGDGLGAGLYHYHPLEHSLRLLRSGDPLPYLARASGAHPALLRGATALVISGIPWRTTWKYRSRGYRHLFWDAGMVVANLLSLARASDLAAEAILGFADGEVDTLLGLDGKDEMALVLLALGGGRDNPPAPSAPPPTSHRVAPLSPRPQSYPDLLEAHLAGSLEVPEDAAAWRREVESPKALSSGRRPSQGLGMGLEAAIRRRGSSRAFLRTEVPASFALAVLEAASSPLPADWDPSLVQFFFIASALQGLEPGVYRFLPSPEGNLVVSLRPGRYRREAAFLCLEQPLGGDAALTCFLMADLDQAVQRLGARGYRAAQLEAGVRAGIAYLASYAQGLGATGLTFYDDEVRQFLETHLEPMLAVAIGVDARRPLPPG